MQHLKRVKVLGEDLLPGMFVSELDRDWSETTFLLQGFSIESQADVEEVKRQCKFVYVDFKSDEEFKNYRLEKTASRTYREQLEASPGGKGYSLRKSLKPVLSSRKRSCLLMKSVFDKIMLGEDFDLHAVRDSVKQNVKSILENQEALMMITMLKSNNEDTAEHCLNVSILSIGFAQHLGFSEDKLEDIGMAAILHDIGLIKVEPGVILKKGRLNENERQQVNKHPRLGHDILLSKPALTPSCIDVALSHHERMGGQGYPRGLKDEQISENVRIVSIVDVFEAITSPKPYRKAMPVMDAYKVLMAGKNSHFDESLVLKFIQWRGIYPPGSIVEMENGEVGIVITTHKKYKLKPKVLLVLDEYKQPRKERLVDISRLELTPESKPYKIIRAYENMAFGIDLQEYADKGLKIRYPEEQTSK